MDYTNQVIDKTKLLYLKLILYVIAMKIFIYAYIQFNLVLLIFYINLQIILLKYKNTISIL